MTLSEQYITKDISISEKLKLISGIEDLRDQVKALTTLASDLPPSQAEVFQEALETVRQISSRLPEAHAQLLALFSQVPESLRLNFLELVISIEDGQQYSYGSERFQALAPLFSTIILELPNSQQKEFLSQVLGAVKHLDNYHLLQAFVVLVPQIILYESDLIASALSIAREADVRVKVQLLALLVPYLAETERSEVLQESLRMAEHLLWGGQDLVTEALAALTPQLYRFCPDLFKQAIRLAKSPSFQGWDTLYRMLMSLAFQLSQSEAEEFVQQAWEVAKHLGNSKALVALIPHLSNSQQCIEVIQEALTAAREGDRYRTEFLLEVLPYLSEPQQHLEVLQEALAAALRPSYSSDQAEALRLVIPHIPPDNLKLQQQALDVARRIGHDTPGGYAALPLADLASLFRGSQQLEILEEALWITRQSQDKEHVVEVLAILAPLLPYSQRLELLQEALNYIQDRPQAIANLAPLIPKDHAVLLRQILTVSQDIQNTELRAKALLSLVSHFPISGRSIVLQQALEVIQQLKQKKYYADEANKYLDDIYSQLSYFQPQLLQKALELGNIQALVTRLPVSNSELIHKALDLIATSSNADVLATLASRLIPSQVDLINRVLDIARSLTEPQDQAKVLAVVASHLLETEQGNKLTEALELVQNRPPVKKISPEEYSTYLIDEKSYAYLGVIPKSLEELQHERENNARGRDANALVAIIPYISSEKNPHILQQVIQQAFSLIETLDKSSIPYVLYLGSLAKFILYLAELKHPDTLRALGLLTTHEHYLDDKIFVALSQLPEPQSSETLKKVWADLLKNKEWEKMATLVSYFPISQQAALLKQALASIDSVRYQAQAKAVALLAIQFPELVSSHFLERVLLNSETEVLKRLIVCCLEELVINLPNHKLPVALKMVATLEEDTDKTKFLSALAPRLSTGLFSNAIRLIGSEIEDDNCCAEVLSNLASYLPEDQFPVVLSLIEKRIKEEFSQSEALSNLVPYLKLSYLPKALQISHSIKNQVARSKALVAISKQLHSLLNEVNPGSQEIVAFSGTSVSEEALQIELSKIAQIEHVDIKLKALITLANYLTRSQKTKILSFALETVSGIQYEAYQAEALSAIAVQLSSNEDELALQALSLAQQIQDKYFKVATLVNLVPKLPEPQRADILQFCLDAAQQIQDPYSQATVLAEVAPYLSDHLCVEQFQQAINIAEQIEYEAERVEAFTVIASRLSFAHPNLLQQVLEITQKLETGEYRDRITQALGNNLSVALVQQILKMLQSNTGERCEKYSSDILCALSPHFLEIQFPDVLKTIETFQDEGYQAQALQALAFQLSNNPESVLINNQKHLDEIWEIVKNFQEDYFKVKVYSASSTTIRQAEFIANNLYKEFKFLGTEAFLEIAINSASVSASTKALEAIRDESLNHHAYLRANYLNRLAPYFYSSQQRLEAQLIAQSIEEDYYRVQSLSVLANYFPELRQQAEEAAKQISNLVHRIELLSALAIETPTILPDLIKLLRRESENDEITNSINRKRVLVALQPHLPARIVREINRERKAGRQLSDELWNRALKQLAKSYREAIKAGGLRNDEALDQDLLSLRDEINSLTNLLLLRDLEPPMVVGILGNWGGGKSYIMHLMQAHMIAIRSQALEQQEAWSDNPYSEKLSPYVGHIYQIKFDAWSFAKSNLWASLMQTIFFELDRQISLELSLQAVGIDLLDDYGNEIWKVLYKTSEDDRQYFLERTLGKDKLEELKAKGQIRSESWTELLWEQYGVTETRASTQLSQKEKELNDVREQLEKAKKDKETILSSLKNQDKQENWISDLLKETTELSGFLIQKYFGKDVAEDLQKALQKELEQKLKKEDIDISDLNRITMAINQTIAEILEEDTIYIGGSKKYSLSWLALKKWSNKNQKLIIAFLLSIAFSIILPIFAAQIKSLNIVSQLAVLITPLIPAIGFAQALFKSNQKWFAYARQAVQDYEDTLKQHSHDKHHNLIDERVTANLRQLDTDVQDLTLQEQILQREVKQAEAALPKDSFASLANFVKARVEEATYDNHLGIMQQVRQDLIKLSQALLPPPANSTEYKVKLEKLKKFFPRGPARVVVYIDDLDRCPPDRVVEVLEAIQLLVKTPLFIAVLAIDERYIIRALEKHYAGVLSRRGRPSGEDYLEKIIQIPYRVRSISASALENYLRSQVVIQDTATGGTKFSEVSRDEFNLLLDGCRYVDLSPRTIKRLTNVYKVFKVVCRTRGTKPSRKVQQAIIALLVLSGRHTNLMREVFADMEAHYEGKGSGEQETIWKLVNKFYESNRSLTGDSYSQREFERFKQDALTTPLIPRDLTLALLTYDLFNLVRSFSFVGDVGYATEDFRSVARTESVDQ